MKKLLSVLLFTVLLNSLFFGLVVDVDEIRSTKDFNVVFENYTGTHASVDTVSDIRAIGFRLSDMQKNANSTYKFGDKYSIVHAIDQSTDKYDSIIFSIDKDSRVDHIDNVRLIVSSYLEKKLGYKRADAATLAKFATFYNAVYRGKVDYFSTKYNAPTLSYIDTTNAGISTKYSEWAGKTKLIIPLTEDAKKGNISSLDTSEISDKNVVTELRKTEDMGIEDRKDLVEIKEKEVEQKKKEALKTEISIDKKQTELDKKSQEIAKKEDKLAEEKKAVETIQDASEKQKKEQEIAKKEEAIAQEKEKLTTEQTKLTEDKTTLETKKEEIAKKEEEIAQDKKEIKKDETIVAINKDPEKVKKELEKKSEELTKKEEELQTREDLLKKGETDKNIFAGTLFYLKVKEYMSGGHYNNELYTINVATNQLEHKSELNNICGNKYSVFKDGVLLIVHQGSHETDHNLILVNRETLEPKIQGKDNVFWRSFIEFKDENIYAILKQGDKYYLGKFDDKLNLLCQSVERVDQDTFISFYEEYIYINGANKDVLILNKSDLTLVKKIGLGM
ncbi:MAG TPA: P83/100 family protein [Spirochaetota bacterium]|nr:P83/100 family protein [Spirochaetota bacterium]HOS32548.1 P83/100 family protein [Spirochaetota bacterium]HOS55994.1 P83/100 family protein [Spirochaetota bacterium]HPK61104.1 P83/100 family protein [Spirochaetota bacterium]HQF76653.1 P83/100 family protein [Spirochaetota bacterium]